VNFFLFKLVNFLNLMFLGPLLVGPIAPVNWACKGNRSFMQPVVYAANHDGTIWSWRFYGPPCWVGFDIWEYY